MTEKLRVLVYRVGQPAEVREIDQGIDAIHQIVGGWFDVCTLEIHHPDHSRISLYCHDEGLVNGMAPNLWAEGPHYLGAPIHGDVVILGTDAAGDSRSLTDAEIARWSQLPRLTRRAS